MWENQGIFAALPLRAMHPAPRQERQESRTGCWQKPGDAVGDTTHTPYGSERQQLKKSRGLFSKRELCTQAGSIFAGKLLKQTSLGKVLHFSKLKKKMQRDTANTSEGI